MDRFVGITNPDMVNKVPNAVKASSFQPLLLRSVGGVEADMLITMGAH
jgi:hypothetical protein